MKILAVIPARGGSKGVPRKNIKMLGGKPLIAWTIEAAIMSGVDNCPIVSTEDAEIAAVALMYGGCRSVRPDELAQDNTPMVDVLRLEATKFEYFENATLDWVMCLQPTTPFRTADDIKAAIALAEAGDCDSVISVVQVDDHHPARMYTIDGDYMKALYPDEETKRRQDLSPLYLRNGAIYLTRRDVIMGGSVWGKRIKPLVMPPERSVNIDSMLDWKLAEAMLVRD